MSDAGKHYTGAYKPSCFESHPPLPVGGGKVIYGGNCSRPVVLDADVYVGLDSSMSDDKRSMPWEDKVSFLYRITDGSVPESEDRFKKLIAWISDQLDAGKKVHVGCIGGHGRTGMVFAALIGHRIAINCMEPVENTIQYVRENYCKKSVETSKQVEFLVKHYGAKTVEGSRTTGTKWSQGGSSGKKDWGLGEWGGSSKASKPIYTSDNQPPKQKQFGWGNTHQKKPGSVDSGTPVRGRDCIWSSRVFMK